MSATPDEFKRNLRLAASASRQALSRAEAGACDARIVAHCLTLEVIARARCVFLFLGVGHEIDTRPLIARLRAAGTHILAPRVLRGGVMRAVEFEGWAALERGALGIPRPRTTEDRSAEVEIAIVPALAFTRQGDRLGYGGGYYDRWLARYPLAVRIGVCRENEIRTGLPTAPHDEPVDALVTEAGARSCGTRRRR